MLASIFGRKVSAPRIKISALELMNLRGQVSAISRSQGVIEFSLNGNIIAANDNFLNILGYSAAKAIGQRLLCINLRAKVVIC